MPDTDILVSELNSASQINTTDLLLMTQPDGDAQTGYSSRKGTVLQVANKLLKDTEYTTDLPNFDNKSVFGALNEIRNGTYIYKENETPYQLRQTPITANRTLEKLIGVSCAFNQLIQNGNFESISTWQTYQCSYTVADNVATITASSASGNLYITNGSISVSVGRKYLIRGTIKNNSGDTSRITFRIGDTVKTIEVTSGNFETLETIVNVASINSRDYAQCEIYAYNNGKTYAKEVNIIDLTACLGSEVADYLYNLENG